MIYLYYKYIYIYTDKTSPKADREVEGRGGGTNRTVGDERDRGRKGENSLEILRKLVRTH